MATPLILKRAALPQRFNFPSKMRCQICKRELAKGEAVYRAAISHSGAFTLFHGSVGSVCTDCAAPIAERKWFAKSCPNCQRPTLFDRVHRNMRYFFCSGECRQAFFNARRRRRTKRRK